MSRFSHTPLGPGAEFDRIRRALARLGSKAVGGGDDCAFVEVGAERLALSCDLTIEDTHFRAGWLAPVELGWPEVAEFNRHVVKTNFFRTLKTALSFCFKPDFLNVDEYPNRPYGLFNSF